jgi:hypothetical protein
LHRRLGGPQIRSRLYGGEINLLPLPGIESRFVSHPSHIIAIILIRVKNIYMEAAKELKV